MKTDPSCFFVFVFYFSNKAISSFFVSQASFQEAAPTLTRARSLREHVVVVVILGIEPRTLPLSFIFILRQGLG